MLSISIRPVMEQEQPIDSMFPQSELPVNVYLDSTAKRALDVVGAIAIGVALSPVLCFTVISLSLQKGPVFFQHERVGRFGKSFYCKKFRTMVVDAEEKLHEILSSDPEAREYWEKEFKLKNDPRVTRVGRFLRKTSFDELPQLLNVIKGEMSLVGPRPIVEREIEKYGSSSVHYLSCKPGLTGIWQASGRSDVQYSRRVAMDRLYSQNANFFLDIRIIAKTVLSVVFADGAY